MICAELGSIPKELELINSIPISGIGAELELKDFERVELELKKKLLKELELNGKELSILFFCDINQYFSSLL